MPAKEGVRQGKDIFALLLETSEKRNKAKREELLKSIGVEEFFEDGSIRIDMKTCKGVECQLCIKACPTSALFWKAGEVGITEDLCIHCTSCVMNCMVDNCIEVKRKRHNGDYERFSKPLDVFRLWERCNTRKRVDVTKMLFPDQEAYLKRYRYPFFEF
jgi:Fe-S-cluster-containing hydrogenase component 2